MQRVSTIFIGVLMLVTAALAGSPAAWRSATDAELAKIIPARAPVEKEHIETELRTASGVVNKDGKTIAGVVMITAGYSADGKYSHYFMTQVPLEVNGVAMKPGEYVFGSKRLDDGAMEVSFYEAANGKPVVTVKATLETKRGAIRSLIISPPENGKGTIKIGRFLFPYAVTG